MLYRHIAFIMLFWWPTFGGDTEESLQSALAFKWADPKISNVRVYQMVKEARKKRLDFQDIEFETVDKFYVTEKANLK